MNVTMNDNISKINIEHFFNAYTLYSNCRKSKECHMSQNNIEKDE